MPSSGGINDSLVKTAVESGELDEATLDTIVARNVALSLSAKDRQTPSMAADLDAQHALARDAAAQCCIAKECQPGSTARAQQSIALIGAFAENRAFRVQAVRKCGQHK